MRPTEDGGGERLLSAKEVAAQIGKSVKTVRAWLNSGHLRGFQAGEYGHWIVPESEIKRLRCKTGE